MTALGRLRTCCVPLVQELQKAAGDEVGVSRSAGESWQRGDLGLALAATGLRRLAAQGVPTAMLYVDADALAAMRAYEGWASPPVGLMSCIARSADN